MLNVVLVTYIASKVEDSKRELCADVCMKLNNLQIGTSNIHYSSQSPKYVSRHINRCPFFYSIFQWFKALVVLCLGKVVFE